MLTPAGLGVEHCQALRPRRYRGGAGSGHRATAAPWSTPTATTCAAGWPPSPPCAVTRLLAEIRELGYTGSANLLVRYLNQGRAHAERASPPPRRLVVVDHDQARRPARTRAQLT